MCVAGQLRDHRRQVCQGCAAQRRGQLAGQGCGRGLPAGVVRVVERWSGGLWVGCQQVWLKWLRGVVRVVESGHGLAANKYGGDQNAVAKTQAEMSVIKCGGG
eukprot:363842-Chlamydomonas_euryale.AAC.6